MMRHHAPLWRTASSNLWLMHVRFILIKKTFLLLVFLFLKNIFRNLIHSKASRESKQTFVSQIPMFLSQNKRFIAWSRLIYLFESFMAEIISQQLFKEIKSLRASSVATWLMIHFKWSVLEDQTIVAGGQRVNQEKKEEKKSHVKNDSSS